MDTKYFAYFLDNINDPLAIKEYFMNKKGRIVFFDIKGIICVEQIKSAIIRSNRNFKNKNMLANSWGLEMLLQMSGKHQISEALKCFEITNKTTCIIVINSQKIDLSLFPFPLKIGFPAIKPKKYSYEMYDIDENSNACKTILSLGALLIADNQ